MPMYDRKCTDCGALKIDCYEPMFYAPAVLCECGGEFQRVHLPGATNSVIGDEIDITVPEVVAKNPDGTPKRYRSREEWKKDIEARGWTNLVEHKGGKGSDKSKHTKPWF